MLTYDFSFRNLPSMSDDIITRIIDVLLLCLKDDNVEVRQMAAKTLAGVLRCSRRSKIPELKVTVHLVPAKGVLNVHG